MGFNFEDQIVGGDGLYPIAEQATRIEAMRKACDAAGVPAYINARTDIFLKAPADTHNAAMLDDAVARAAAFQSAGASGFFAPGLKDEAMIEQLCAATELAGQHHRPARHPGHTAIGVTLGVARDQLWPSALSPDGGMADGTGTWRHRLRQVGVW